jgi:hypothetical protein
MKTAAAAAGLELEFLLLCSGGTAGDEGRSTVDSVST